MERRTFLKLATMAAAGNLALKDLALPGKVWAKELYPARKISWIVPVKPGGGVDTLARFLSLHLRPAFKELVPAAKGGNIIIKNVPEASGRRAYSTIFRAEPDGYTIGDFNLGFITENITAKPEFDVTKFTFLLRTGVSIRVIATRKDGFKNWKELMAAAKVKELKWAAGNYGRGAHIDSILAKEAMGIPAKLINFAGTAESASAIIRGDVQVGLFSMDSIQGLLKAGEFRLLLIFDDKSEFPGVPTSTELGYPDLAENIRYQRFIIGPPGVSKDVAGIIAAAFRKALTKPEVREWADRMEFPILPLYGNEADKVARKVMNFYVQMTPTLMKYLK
ncbi:MAG: tripartite tricarboxylate transporter substrate binding protein [Deltaproteobacteria bacterium]|nr:tripartite tricarboxylate transporter substrate binding protein [Deltaproteobacteria bacterium]